MMKKTVLLFIMLSLIALAVVLSLTNSYSADDKMSRKNVEAWAQDLPIKDEEDGSSEEPGGGGSIKVWCVRGAALGVEKDGSARRCEDSKCIKI